MTLSTKKMEAMAKSKRTEDMLDDDSMDLPIPEHNFTLNAGDHIITPLSNDS